MSIRLSAKHGVNPSVTKCFWCGEAIGVALLGRIKGDVKAPREIVLNYDPCDTCKKGMDSGILVFEANTTGAQNQPPMKTGYTTIYPTGRWVVITKEAALRMWGHLPFYADMVKAKKIAMEGAAYSQIVAPAQMP